jgi:TolB-like protein/DNA-binding winged helix-turn-helix (wHTH) protein/Flp pilus assembly protein TadD
VATSTGNTPIDRPSVICFGGFEVDLQSGVVSRNGTKNSLRGQPLQLLELLLRQPGQIVTREDIQRHLWPNGTVVEFEHSVNAAVKRLRAALEDDPDKPAFIETIPRRGYRFIARIENASPSASVAVEKGAAILPPMVSAEAEPHMHAERGLIARYVLTASIVVALLVVLFFMVRSHSNQVAPHRIRSLAVLPLKNLSGDPAQEYLADGMTEALIGRLSKIQNLHVISRTSVMRFKDPKASVPEIARTLGVDAIVEGSVIREGSRIRVQAQLIRTSTDEHFWSEEYDRNLSDVLALQSDVAQAIAEKVKVTVTGQERARLVLARQVSPEVYESYLKGRYVTLNTEADGQRSVGYFKEAIKKDPTFAPAYVGLANAYLEVGTPAGGVPPKSLQNELISTARKALELDPTLPEAHLLLGLAHQNLWEWSDAEREFKQALELGPNDASTHVNYATWLLCQGRIEEAQAWARRGRELDPLTVTGHDLGWILIQSRRYDEAIRELRSELAVHPDGPGDLWFLGYALIAKGAADEAIPVLEKAVLLSNRTPAIIGVLIHAYAQAGRRTEAIGLVRELKRRQQKGYVPAAAFVNAYLGLEDNEQAFAWMERAYQEQSMILQYLRVHPFFDPVRDDPRFKDLARRVGLD